MFSRGQPKYYYEEQASLPPLSLIALATMIRERSEHEFEILDAANLKFDYSRMRCELKSRAYDIVGITCLSNTLADATHVARAAKAARPDAPVVMGGFHPTIYPNETVALDGVDYVCLGAGDFSLIQLMDTLGQGAGGNEINNIISETIPPESILHRTAVIKDYTGIPIPDRSLLPVHRYYSAITQNPPATVMMSGTGCPFGCAFCNTSKEIYLKSVDGTVDEMAHCESLGIREILFQDELFIYNRKRILDLCEAIRTRGLKIPWSIKTRIETVTPELMRAMREANMFSIHFGIEAGTEKVLAAMRKGKNQTMENIRRAVAQARAAGLSVTSSFMIGYIDETEEDILKTIRFARSLPLDYAQFSIAQPLPFTEMYEEGLRRGLFKSDVWREFAATANPDFNPPYWTETISNEDLHRLLNLAYRRFYVNMKYILRRLRSVKSAGGFLNAAKIGLRIALGF